MLDTSLCTFFTCCSCQLHIPQLMSNWLLVSLLFNGQRQHIGRIPHDQAIEVTNNKKDAKSHGGIIGISLRPAAVFKWMVLRADLAVFTGSSM